MDVPKKIIRKDDFMVLKKEEIMEQVKGIIGENTDDASLKFLEDLSDTMDELNTKATGDGVDWKAKFEENDKEWRNKYQSRFFTGAPDDGEGDGVKNDLTDPTPLDDNEGEDDEPTHFEDLFTTES